MPLHIYHYYLVEKDRKRRESFQNSFQTASFRPPSSQKHPQMKVYNYYSSGIGISCNHIDFILTATAINI